MEQVVRDKLREIYDRLSERSNTILEQFIDQFGESFVDSTFCTFDELVNILSNWRFCSLVEACEGQNDFGSYRISEQEYEEGDNKLFLEYVPDLGILDYLTPKIEAFLGLSRGQTMTIRVYFPNVRVTNEYDKFIDIQDLYARVVINGDGELLKPFELSRATYSYEQFRAGYAHSHMHKITMDNIGKWQEPCVGTGPIRYTMRTLFEGYDKQIWGLFVYELAKYVTIESVVGTPYIRLESVGRGSVEESMSNLYSRNYKNVPISSKHLIEAFIKHCADNCKFKFKFVHGQYQLGESATSTIINLSNEFIKFLNDYKTRMVAIPSLNSLISNNILNKYIISNGKIYTIDIYGRSIDAANRISGQKLFTFKGHPVELKILVDNNTIENKSLLLSKTYCEFIITNVLSIINYTYGKKQNQRGSSQSNNSQSGTQIGVGEKPFIF